MPTTAALNAPSSFPPKALIAGRIVVAATQLFTPRLVAEVFGMESRDTPAIACGRMFGIRNAALALGLINLGSFGGP
ncbi:hypothetical protein [Rhodococcus sp. RS1C4]|nr:hypothetical protein [Rhodococcus sp. RS1C4]